MAVHIEQSNKLVITIEGYFPANQYYNYLQGLVYALKHQDELSKVSENWAVLDLLSEMLPDEEQAKRMFASHMPEVNGDGQGSEANP